MRDFRLVLLAATAMTACAASAQAQVATTNEVGPGQQTAAPASPDTETATADQSKDVIVTGTLIRGVAPVGSAVIAVGREEIQQSGFSTTEEVLKSIPQITNIGPTNVTGANSQNANLNSTRAEAINIRGIGPQATLALLDGRRVPANGTAGQLFDAASLPAIALARIDVVADGASATYGSDAVAGVANFILRKNFEGAEITGRYNFADNYRTHQVAAIVGHQWDGGGIMLAGQYDSNTTLFQTRRANYYQCDERAFGFANNCVNAAGTPQGANATAPGNLVFTTGSPRIYGLPAGSGVGVTAAQLSPTANIGSNARFLAVVPQASRYNAIFSGHVDVGPVTLWSEAYYARHNINVANGYLNFTAAVPNTNPNFVVVPGQSGATETVQYALVNEVGPTYRRGYGESYQTAAGFDAKLFGDIKATLYYEHNGNAEYLFSPGLNTGLLAQALACTGAVCLNPYGTGGSASNIAAAASFVGGVQTNAFYSSNLANGKVDGSLFHIGGGDVKFAVGGEWHWDRFLNYNYQNTTAASTSILQQVVTANTRYTRKVTSAFAEVIIPLVGPENAMPFIRKLTIDVAGRYDHYTDVGNTTNPKVGVVWAPIDDLTLRGSYGTSFRAPTPCDSNALCTSVVLGNGAASTALYGQRTSNAVTIGGGNGRLTPETATTWSLGADLKPHTIPGLAISVNYFNIDYKNVIYTPGNSATVFTNPLYAQFVTVNPTQAQVAAVTALPFFSGLPTLAGCASLSATNTTAFQCLGAIVDGRRNNAGEEKLSGIDFTVNYRMDTGIGRFRFGVNGTYLFNFDVSIVPGAPFVKTVNQLSAVNLPLGDPLHFRGRGQLGWSGYGFDFNSFVNYANSYRIIGVVTPTQNDRVSAYATVDANLSYTLGANTGALHDLRLGVSVFNLFNKYPPIAVIGTAQQYDPANGSVIGRTVSLSLAKKF